MKQNQIFIGELADFGLDDVAAPGFLVFDHVVVSLDEFLHQLLELLRRRPLALLEVLEGHVVGDRHAIDLGERSVNLRHAVLARWPLRFILLILLTLR